MGNKFLHKILVVALVLMSAGLSVQAEELCMEGTLLFREDFGGNDPNDPGVSMTPVQGMSSAYSQVTNLAPKGNSNDMGSGHYLVAKQGYRNSTLTDYSVWHIMDDHTYPGDKTRGYLLEVDGKGGTDAFFQTTMSGLCAGSKLTFSAYIANLETAAQYAKWKREGRNSANPKISFVITNLTNGAELARYNSDTISHDWSNYPKNWRESADWQLVGMTFIVPEGVETLKLSIHNNVSASNGNDFALDDIEVRLCAPPVSIEGEAEVCTNSSAFLTTNFTNDGTFAEPLEYKWWFSADSLNWTELSETTNVLSMPTVQKADSGWYKVAVAGMDNIESTNCRAMSEPFLLKVKKCEEPLCMDGTLLFREDFGGNDPSDPEVITNANEARAAVPGMSANYTPCISRTSGMSSGKFLVTKQGYQNGIQWHLMDDHTYPGDLTKGYLLQIDGRGDNLPFYTTTIDGLCPGSRLTFSAYVANVMTWGHYMNPDRHDIYPRLKFVLTDPVSDQELATYDTGEIPFDSAFIDDNEAWRSSAHWRLIGMNFKVPDDTYRVKLTIYNSVSQNGSGNDFVLDDIEVRLCAPPVMIEGDEEVCTNATATLRADFTNDGTFAEPLGYKWWFSADSLNWTELSETTNVLSMPAAQKADSGWYKVAVSSLQDIENLNCRAMSEPFLLNVKECVEELCIEGTLLFREDFGGNSLDDPDISMASVQGMDPSYHNSGNSLGSGNYTLRKEGWHNGIQWHWQDDHTYFGDKTRGYLLEVDGVGGAKPFYSKTIEGLCAGSKLTFSAYVVNVHYAGQINWLINNRGYVYPRMKFVLKDPTTGSVLAEKTTGDILPDPRYTTEEEWRYARENSLSAEWQLIGMNFTVPDGVESIQMFIYNDVAQNGNGNDFALDDIEIHLCAPPVTIDGEAEICADSSVMLTANFTNDGTFHEPLAYKWWHSLDSVTWTEMSGFNGEILTFSTIQKADSGWYKVAVAGADNIESVNCRATSEPFRLRVNECEPPEPPVEELCMDGILLFREDFGGNDPNDPMVGTDRVSGMDYSRYTQRLNADHVTGQAGLFWLIKSGYYHADTTRGRDPMKNHSNWYLQDDHTYPNDKTRGYLLEIDGLGGTAPFYSTVVHGVCPGTRLTFSAYVANVNKASNYIDGVHARIYPKLKFEIADAKTHTVLGSHSTGDIPYDPDLTVNTDFWYSSKWYLHGMTFTMPEAVDSIRLTIYNDVMNNGAGNDFALDDIEIRLCMTPDTIRTDTTVCDTLQHIAWRGKEYAVADTLRDTVYSHCGFDSIYYELHVETEHCDEGLCIDGILLFREDFGGNDPNDPRVSQDPVPGMTYEQALTDVWNPNNLSVKAGRYIVTKSGYCNGDTASTNTPNNRRSQWFLQDDHTYPGDYTRGYFMEVDGKEKSDGAVFYTTTIDGLCEGVELSCLAYVANVQMPWYYENQTRVYPRLLFTLLDPADHSVLKTYDTGDIPYDSTYMGMFDYDHSSVWRRVGMTFTVPSGVNAVQLQIANNADGRNGNDFALDDIEVRLCMPPIHIKGVHQVCAGDEVILDTETDYPYMVYEPLYYEWWYSTDNRNWTKTDEGIGHYQLHIPSADASHGGWYKVVMGTEGRMDSEKCHTTSEWFHLKVQECQSPVAEESYNELVCDTLLPMTWHDIVWTAAGTTDFMLTDRNGDDSVHVTLTLDVQTCCPDVQTVELDSIVCGYLLPFTWELEGHFVIFGSPEVQEVRIPHPRWSNCTQTVYSLSLDTVHCDLLYPIIVNKYNWVLLVDNAKVRELFPERTVVGYQWYKDEQPISGATEDDYSETNELHGVFQMYLTLDGGDVIRSNIIDLSHTPELQSAHVRAYNSSGVLICQWETSDPAEYPALPAGIYLLRIEQGETCLSRKIIVL